jgi:hypothetical protein
MKVTTLIKEIQRLGGEVFYQSEYALKALIGTYSLTAQVTDNACKTYWLSVNSVESVGLVRVCDLAPWLVDNMQYAPTSNPKQ